MLSKRLFIGLVSIVGILALGMIIVTAQGNGNGNGNDNGNNGDCPSNCVPATDGTGNQVQSSNQVANQAGYQYEYRLQFGEPVNANLSDDVIEGLTVTLLDEYAAYDIYSDIIEQLGDVIPFVNLRNAEATHALALERIFLRYGLALPERTVVTVPEFTSISEACAWAYDIETTNVALYDTYLPIMEAYPDMTQVMTSLRDASLNNHIPALEACVSN